MNEWSFKAWKTQFYSRQIKIVLWLSNRMETKEFEEKNVKNFLNFDNFEKRNMQSADWFLSIDLDIVFILDISIRIFKKLNEI